MRMHPAALVLSFLCCSRIIYGSVLTFEIDGAYNYMALNQNYGDRITQETHGIFHYGLAGGPTPNIDVSYNRITLWSTGFNQLVWVANNESDGDNLFSLTFTADAGQRVYLNGFDLGNYGSSMVLPGISILNENNETLFEQQNVLLPSNTQPHLDFDFSMPLSGQSVTIIINTSGLGGSSDNVGLDNICFSQTSTGSLADLNQDCRVDEIDLALLIDQWLFSSHNPEDDYSADLNCDGIVNLEDFAIMAANWLQVPQECIQPLVAGGGDGDEEIARP